jgi:hypothetical protein
MPRTRTKPTPITTAFADTIEFIALQIAYTSALEVSLVETKLTYGIANRDSAGEIIHRESIDVPWNDLPANVKAAYKDIYALTLIHAESKGHIGAGTDSGDLP